MVVGEAARSAGFALGGASVVAAEDPVAVRRAMADLPEDTAVLVLTPAAARAGGEVPERVLTVVMPE